MMRTAFCPGCTVGFRWLVAFNGLFLGGILSVLSAPAQEAAPGGPEPRPPLEADAPEEPPSNLQQYKTLPVDESQKREASDIARILRAGRFVSEQEKQKFDKFYGTYFLARWTQPGNFASLHRFRQELRNHFRLAKGGEVFNHLNEFTLAFMGKIAGDNNYAPAARINAMLEIGELNRIEQTAGEAAVPLPETLPVLIAAAENVDLPDSIRAAALIGVMRHAAANASDEARRAISAAMLRLAAAEPTANSTTDGHGWLVAQAFDALGALGSVGENNAAYLAAMKAAGDAKLPLYARLAAVNALGRFNYASAAGISPIDAAVALGQFAAEGCAEELRLAKSADHSAVERRRILHWLAAVLFALGGEDANRNGIASLAKEQGPQAYLAELQKIVKDAVETLDDQRKKDDDMKPVIEDLQKNLDAWLKKKP